MGVILSGWLLGHFLNYKLQIIDIISGGMMSPCKCTPTEQGKNSKKKKAPALIPETVLHQREELA